LQPVRQALQQALAIGGAVGIGLFVLLNVGTDHPVAQGQADVDGLAGLLGQRVVRLLKAGLQGDALQSFPVTTGSASGRSLVSVTTHKDGSQDSC